MGAAEKVSRRDFLKLSGLGLAGLLLPSGLLPSHEKRQSLPLFSPEDVRKGNWLNWYTKEFNDKDNSIRLELDKKTLVKQWGIVSSGVDSAGKEGVRIYDYTTLIPKNNKTPGSSLPVAQDIAHSTALAGTNNLYIVPSTIKNYDGTYTHFPTVIDITGAGAAMFYGEPMMPTFLSPQSTVDVFGSSKVADLLREQNIKNVSMGLSGFDILRHAKYLGDIPPHYTSKIDSAVGKVFWSPRPLKWVAANSRKFNTKLVNENIRKGPLVV